MNASTGKCPYELAIGFRPRLLPAVFPVDLNASNVPSASQFVRQLERDLADARDNLLAAKTRQAAQANKHRRAEDVYAVGDLVLVNTRDRRHLYKVRGRKRSAKLMPRYSGPYEVLEAFPESSNYRLKLADGDKTHPVFHASKLKRYVENDESQFPGRSFTRPGPVPGAQEDVYVVDRIVDERLHNGKREFRVRWTGYSQDDDTWEPASHFNDSEPLEEWRRDHPTPPFDVSRVLVGEGVRP